MVMLRRNAFNFLCYRALTECLARNLPPNSKLARVFGIDQDGVGSQGDGGMFVKLYML